MVKRAKTLKEPYGAYNSKLTHKVDEELTGVGRGTPCGEYMRRYWQPIALSDELGDLPVAIRILGEDLVVFRDGAGRVGLLERRCCHRGTSLEFGKIEERGISCCYHGWRFDVDGRILDTPGEPPESRIKEKIWQGAYPVFEIEGIVFAYMGPPDRKPVFPHYDFLDRPGRHFTRHKVNSPCSWLQVRENEMDPVHITFLHTRLFGTQFTDAFGAVPTIEWRETPVGMIYVSVRRWGEYLYLRTNDMIMPNIARVAGIEDAEGETVFDRRATTTNWVVPIDDTNCMSIGWDEHEDDLPDPRRDGYLDRMTRAGNDAMGPADVGQTGEPSYEERQRAPGDWDVWVSQGPVHAHAREHLGATDRGVSMYRNLVRDGIRAVKAGADPKGISRDAHTAPLLTYAHNTVKLIPPADTPGADRALSLTFGRDITAQIMSGALRRGATEAAE
jgi:nitrite reductase/ring-hydroxylating ferredoxin subunit